MVGCNTSYGNGDDWGRLVMTLFQSHRTARRVRPESCPSIAWQRNLLQMPSGQSCRSLDESLVAKNMAQFSHMTMFPLRSTIFTRFVFLRVLIKVSFHSWRPWNFCRFFLRHLNGPHQVVITNGHFQVPRIQWLVGGWATPLKNISQLGWLFPIYGKIKNGNQTTNQMSSINCNPMDCWIAGKISTGHWKLCHGVLEWKK